MRRSIGRGWFRGWLVAACVATVARAASAQDYSVTQVWDQYETPPAGVTDLAWGADGYASYGSWVDLPFDFPYFGVLYDRVWFCKFGFAQLGKAIGWTSPDDGEFPQPSDSNGVLAVKWDWLRTLSSSRMYSWVAGEAPNRRAVLAWVGLQPGYGITGRVVRF